MEQDQLIFIALLGIAALSVIVVIYLLVAPYTTGEKRVEKRMQTVADGPGRIQSKIQDAANSRKRQVSETLKELEEKQKASKKVSLRQRLQQGGLNIDPKSFYVASAVSGLVIAVLTTVLRPNLNVFVIIALGVAGALGLPRFILARMIKRRQSKFLQEFANSIDVIVRGVKSGLPLNECLNIISREAPDPVGGEFREVCEQQRVGVPLAQCFDRMMDRVPLSEVRFFSIVISIQQSAGGNLSEALGNLSGVLRDRKTMAGKVQALSAEAKASAAVLGSLPFIVMLMTYLSSPDYIRLLFTTMHGNFMLLGAGIWMTVGLLIMKKMINFKF